MKIFTEKEAEKFLENNGFGVFKRIYIKEKNELRPELEKFNLPVVMKISGKKIIHKKVLGGVIVGVSNFS